MTGANTANSDHETPIKLPTLFEHTKREQWGLAILVFSGNGRMRLQFQDGRQRRFASTHAHLLQPVSKPLDETIDVVNDLRSLLPDASGKKIDRKKLPITFDEQLEQFRLLYDGGFGSDAFLTAHRMDESRKRPLKRHRDVTIADAKDKLPKKAFAPGNEAEVFEHMLEVLHGSDLVPPKLRKQLGQVPGPHRELVARTLGTLLYGKKNLVDRFDQWVSTLRLATGDTPSWQLATFFLGVLFPEKHVVVRPDVFDRQAQWMAPGLKCGTEPTGRSYERMLNLATKVGERLEREGETPRDLMDVYELMNATLKAGSRKEILARREAASATAEAA